MNDAALNDFGVCLVRAPVRTRKKVTSPSRIFSLKNLHAVWKESPDYYGKGKAPGVDGITAEKFREHLDSNLRQIRNDLVQGKYRFKNLKPYPIPKGNGKHRIICVPTVQDRLVQRVILKHLTVGLPKPRPDKSKDLLGIINDISFGVVKGDHGTHAAIEKALKMRAKNCWVLKTDISTFFDKIPRKHLIALIQKKRGAQSSLKLLTQIVASEVDEKDKNIRVLLNVSGLKRGSGLRQGMPLSPLLSNLVLAPFDKSLARKRYKVIRYVDDLVIFADSYQECAEAEQFVKSELKKIQLSIPGLEEEKSKTQIRKPEDPVEFLGVEIYQKSPGNYLKRVPSEAVSAAVQKMEGFGNYQFCASEGLNLVTALQRIHSSPRGYETAYKGTSNLPDFLNSLKKAGEVARMKLLEDVFGKGFLEKLPKEKQAFLGILPPEALAKKNPLLPKAK